MFMQKKKIFDGSDNLGNMGGARSEGLRKHDRAQGQGGQYGTTGPNKRDQHLAQNAVMAKKKKKKKKLTFIKLF